MIFSEKYDKILPLLVKVKKELNALKKSADNPFFKSKYADLNQHLDEVEPKLEKEGLVLLQPTSVEHGDNIVSSIVLHTESGQYVKSSMKLVGDNDMQKAGGGVTYGRRYTLNALFAMQSEDDDGNTASGKTTTKASSSNKKAPTGRSGFRKPKAKTTPSVEDSW